MSVIDSTSLSSLKESLREKRIIFCSGSFDLTHAGHVLFLESCKARGDVLVVGVGNDENISNYKGIQRPILNEHMRLKMIDSLKPVDYCFLVSNPKEDPFQFLEHVFPELRPAEYVVNDDARNIERRAELCTQYGVTFTVLQRECPPHYEDISTSGIIKKAIEKYKD